MSDNKSLRAIQNQLRLINAKLDVLLTPEQRKKAEGSVDLISENTFPYRVRQELPESTSKVPEAPAATNTSNSLNLPDKSTSKVPDVDEGTVPSNYYKMTEGEIIKWSKEANPKQLENALKYELANKNRERVVAALSPEPVVQ